MNRCSLLGRFQLKLFYVFCQLVVNYINFYNLIFRMNCNHTFPYMFMRNCDYVKFFSRDWAGRFMCVLHNPPWWFVRCFDTYRHWPQHPLMTISHLVFYFYIAIKVLTVWKLHCGQLPMLTYTSPSLLHKTPCGLRKQTSKYKWDLRNRACGLCWCFVWHFVFRGLQGVLEVFLWPEPLRDSGARGRCTSQGHFGLPFPKTHTHSKAGAK